HGHEGIPFMSCELLSLDLEAHQSARLVEGHFHRPHPGLSLERHHRPLLTQILGMDDRSVCVANLDERLAPLDVAPLPHDRGGIGIPPRVVLAHGEGLRRSDLEFEVAGSIGHLEVVPRRLRRSASGSDQEPCRPSHAAETLHAPPLTADSRSTIRSTTYSASSPTPRKSADFLLWSQCMPTK